MDADRRGNVLILLNTEGSHDDAEQHHYLLEPGWRADQAIQGLGRTHRTHQASAPLFRPVATDVKGQRRFIATIARRLDSLGAITRGQRDSQTAMGGDDTALFRASDNLESLYAKSALRQFYIALWRGHIEGWSLTGFEEATGLKLTWEGSLKEDLPPMSQYLNRLLALPIAEQNTLFAALETRIEANIEHAIEAGTFERGVETIAADSLSVASREIVFAHEGSGADTEIVEIARKDKLEPLTADAALRTHAEVSDSRPRLMVNAHSKRAALVRPQHGEAPLPREAGRPWTTVPPVAPAAPTSRRAEFRPNGRSPRAGNATLGAVRATSAPIAAPGRPAPRGASRAPTRSWARSAEHRGLPAAPTRYTVVDAITGHEYGTFESHAEVAGCLAFSRLCADDVEIVVDAPVMANYASWA